MSMISRYVCGFFFLFCLISSLNLPAQENLPGATIFKLLRQQDVKNVELVIEMDSIMANRRTERRIPAQFIYRGPGGEEHTYQVEVNVRGRFRRMRCDFPPLMINFVKKDLRAAGLDTHNNLKLVTQCLNTSQGEDLLLREYLIYRLYNLTTTYSYGAHLVSITYRSPGKGHSKTQYAILLEDENELAERFQREMCEDCFNRPLGDFDSLKLAQLSMFQYMVGNADWSPRILRNVKMLLPTDSSLAILVPFDFDFSGSVNAPYAIPPNMLGIKTVRERVYLGHRQPAEVLQEAFKCLKSKQAGYRELIDSFSPLSAVSRGEIRRYLDDFFRKMEREAPGFEKMLKEGKML